MTVAGDAVTFLQTGQWPFLLRALPQKDEFEWIGMCYVEGCADGAFVLEKQAAGEEPKRFNIW